MKWFRHFSNASESLKLSTLIDKFGIQGYGRYWLTLELLAKHWDGSSNVTIALHPKTLARHLGYNKHTSAKQWAKNGELIGLWSVNIEGDCISFDCPILRELQDKNSKYNKKRVVGKSQPATLEEEADKEEEVEGDDTSPTPSNFDPRKFLDAKKILPPEEPQDFRNPKDSPKFTPDHFVDLWNEIMGKRLTYAKSLGRGKHFENFLAAKEFLPTEDKWRELLLKCVDTPYLMGQNDKGWTLSPTWIVDFDNAIKVLNGDYDDDKAIKNLFADMKSQEAV